MLQIPRVMSEHEGRRAQTAAPRHPRTPKPPPPRHNGGFCTIRSILPACRRRVAPLMLQIPPFAGSEIAVRGDEVPTSQTTSTKNADNGPSWARRPALWTQRRPASHGARTRTRYCECSPAISHVNPLFRVWAGLPTLALAGERANQRAQARISGPTCARVRSLGAVSHAIRLSELSTASTNVAIPPI